MARKNDIAPLDIHIDLQPKELRLLELMNDSDSMLIGYGGARGGAKSHAARSAAVIRRLMYPGTRALIFRRTYDQLWQQHISQLMTEWPDLYKRYWSSENKALMLPQNSMVLFRYADTLKDVLEFKGKEYGDVFIDEATDLTEEQIKILFTCCRTAVHPEGFRPKKVLTFNPGGLGHGYVKRVFITKELERRERVQNPAFIQSYAWDNVLWVKDSLEQDGLSVSSWWSRPQEEKIKYLIERSDYGKELDALPSHLRKAWLFGDWDTFQGQMFEEFNREIHVCAPFKIPAWWDVWMSNDPGFNDDGVWHWFAADGDGNVYITHELSFKRVAHGEQGRLVQEFQDLIQKKAEEQIPAYCVTGMDAYKKDPNNNNKTQVDYYQTYLKMGFRPPVHGAGVRAQQAATMHEYLHVFENSDTKKRTAKLHFFDNGVIDGVPYGCPRLIETLPSLVIDPNNNEAIAECPIDHWFQCAAYGLQSRHPSGAEAPKPKHPETSAFNVLKLGNVFGGEDEDE